MKRVKMIAKIVAGLMVLQIAAGNISIGDNVFAKSTSSKSTAKITSAPLNSAFTEYLKKAAAGKNVTSLNGKGLGGIPALHLVTKGSKTSAKTAEASLPAKYDLRDENAVSSVKDQSDIGSCWAFGANGAMESDIMKAGGSEADFSENNIITHNGWTILKDQDDWGGCREQATGYYTRRDNNGGLVDQVPCTGGPLLEQQDPYPNILSVPNNVERRDTSTLTPQRYVHDALFLKDVHDSKYKDMSQLNELKSTIQNYGAVQIAVDATDYFAGGKTPDPYYNPATNSLYVFDNPNDTADDYTDHDVVVVGWDDSYPATNFKTTAPGNGAFIVKNSWGKSWGAAGYFYLSYYDKFIGLEGTAYLTKPASTEQNVYQYDYLGNINDIGVSGQNTQSFANVFTPKSTGEALSSVSFYTPEENENYEAYLIDNFTGDFSQGTLLQKGTEEYAGYHTVDCNPVTLSGNKFAIVVKATAADSTVDHDLIPIQNYQTGYTSDAASLAKAGRGYISTDGKNWTDITDYDGSASICLKAFTDSAVISSLPSGTYIGAQNVKLTAADPTVDNRIFFTLDGSTPTVDYTNLFYEGKPIVLSPKGESTTVTLKYMVYNKTAKTQSSVYTQTFTIKNPSGQAGSYSRLSGPDRYATSVEISKKGFNSSDYVVLASGDNTHYPDALAAAPLAKAYNAPILLTPSTSLPAVVENEIIRLHAKNVIIAGGTGAVSADIEGQLKDLGISCTRLAGTDRYDTSVVIAKYLISHFNDLQYGYATDLIVATGNGFADALSIASYAAATRTPIILSNKDSLGDSGKALVKAIGQQVSHCYIIGGTGVISDANENAITGLLNKESKVTRLSGANRYATNQVILSNLDQSYDVSNVYFATGQNFPDAVAGSALAAQTNSPIILVSPNASDNTATSKYVASKISSMNYKYVFGGTSTVSDSIMSRVLTGK